MFIFAVTFRVGVWVEIMGGPGTSWESSVTFREENVG